MALPSATGSRSKEEWEDWMKWDDPSNATESTRDSGQILSSAMKSPTVSKKRKSLSDEERTLQTSSSAQKQRPPPTARSHNIVERRYRTNINQKITALRDSIPSLSAALEPESRTSGLEDIPAQKLNKATVLSTAVDYIHDLEKDKRRLETEIFQLRARLQEAQKPDSDVHYPNEGLQIEAGSISLDEGQKDTGSCTASSTSSNPIRGMIDVPEDIRRLRSAGLQAHYAEDTYIEHDDASPDGPDSIALGANGAKRAKFVGKLMIGSFAGLMVMHGFDGGRQDKKHVQQRSLLAFPTLNQWRVAIGSSTPMVVAPNHSHVLFVMLKMFIVLFVLGFGIFLYAFRFKPKASKLPQKPDSPPSLASPLEVRRNAWLTAIQTVRVPRHSMFPEWAAVNLEALQYVLRHMIGWRGYSWLTGKNEDGEVARVRAWDIAIDAQLMGGDAEISGSRLVLTILASGTLPKTPARLLLKAIHLRILLWKTSQPGRSIIWSVVHRIAAALADYQWRLAQDMQRKNMVPQGQPPQEAESLPEHLAAVLKLSCNEALTDPIIHRAQNLAWSRPTREDLHGNEDEMDLVVEDPTIRSPNDALCAWVSSATLQRCLLTTLANANEVSSEIEWDFGIALHTAPAASIAQARSLAANAVFVTANRQNALAMLLQDFSSSEKLEDVIVAFGRTENSAFVDSSLPRAVCHDIGLATRCAVALGALEHAQEEPQELERTLRTVSLGYTGAKELTWLSFASAYHLICIMQSDERGLDLHKRGTCEISSRLSSWLENMDTAESIVSQHTKKILQLALNKHQTTDSCQDKASNGSTKGPVKPAISAVPETFYPIQLPSTVGGAASATSGPAADKGHPKPKDRRPSHCSDDSGYISREV